MSEASKIFVNIGRVEKRKREKTTYRKSQARIMRAKRSEDMDIGPIPEVVNPERRESCKFSLLKHAVTYHPERFDKEFGPNHLMAIEKLEYSILHFGFFAFAMPRGEGKTTLSEIAGEWGTLHGHIRFPVIIGSDKDAAEEILKSLKTEIESNDLLLEDFPEVCYPIVQLDGISNRTKGQTCCGQHTHIVWKNGEIVFPTVEGSQVSGTVIKARGLLGRIRGLKHTTASGESIRPDCVLLDDPQTDESANSDSQCKRRETVIRSAIMGLAGPGKEIAAVMPCTIIRKGDLVYNILNRKRNPEWRGVIKQMIINWPENLKFWEEQYRDVYLKGLENEDEGKAANDFYLANKEKLEKGAKVSWNDRKTDNDVTALQHAMNLYFKVGKAAFYSEYQNDPIDENPSLYKLTPEIVASRVNGYEWQVVPERCNFFVAMIDINLYGLLYTVIAGENDLTSYVVDYSKYPNGRKPLYDRENPEGLTQSQAVFKGVVDLLWMLSEEPFIQNDKRRQLDGVLIDANWGEETETVFRAIDSVVDKLPFDVIADRGRSSKDYRIPSSKKIIGEPRKELHCEHGNFGRQIVHNADFWRMDTQKSFLLPPGTPGSTSLFGYEPEEHEEFAKHICSERLLDYVTGQKRDFYDWWKNPTQKNEWLDTTVGGRAALCFAGASPIHNQKLAKLKGPEKPKEHVIEAESIPLTLDM